MMSTPAEPKYRTLADLPLLVFMACTIREEYHLLLNAEADLFNSDAARAEWIRHYSEFCRVCDDPRVRDLASRTARIRAKASRIQRIRAMVILLRVAWDKRWIDGLKEDGFPGRYDHKNPTAYAADLNRVETKLKREELTLNDMLRTATGGRDKEGGDITEEHFETQLMEISKFEGPRVTAQNTSALQYAIYLKRLRQHIDNLEIKAAKKVWNC